MIETIVTAIIVLISFLTGYFLGFVRSNPTTIEELKEEFNKQERTKEGIKPGVVKRPTKERLEYLKNPEKQGETDAMKEILDPLVHGGIINKPLKNTEPSTFYEGSSEK